MCDRGGHASIGSQFFLAGRTIARRCWRSLIRILLVEDDLLIARAMARLLSREFDVVDVVDDADTALRRIDVDRVDVVITDYDLGPGRPNGIVLARAIAARAPEVPIILVTGSLDERLHEAAKAAGVRMALAKPVPSAELVAAIRATVRARDVPGSASSGA